MTRASDPLRVLIAEDNVDLAAAVSALLESETDIEVVGVVDRVDALLSTARSCGARVIVLDLNLSGESSVPAMEVLRGELPQVAVVVYSGYDRRDVAGALPALGTVEFVSKTGDYAELVAAVRRVASNETADAGR
jgi:DNA-binding NarL/FixJ family response regulator